MAMFLLEHVIYFLASASSSSFSVTMAVPYAEQAGGILTKNVGILLF